MSLSVCSPVTLSNLHFHRSACHADYGYTRGFLGVNSDLKMNSHRKRERPCERALTRALRIARSSTIVILVLPPEGIVFKRSPCVGPHPMPHPSEKALRANVRSCIRVPATNCVATPNERGRQPNCTRSIPITFECRSDSNQSQN